jgi:hypothetical protein
MKCVNGHPVKRNSAFCSTCGVNDFGKGVEINSEGQGGRFPGVLGNFNPQKLLLVAFALVFVIAIVAVIASSENKKTIAKPHTTTSLSTGPTVSYMKQTSLSDFNSHENVNAPQSNCTYDPSQWKPGYKFVCYIYDYNNSGIGEVDIVSTSTASASTQTWNESYNLY